MWNWEASGRFVTRCHFDIAVRVAFTPVLLQSAGVTR